jgi:hypothetical protein
MTTSEARKQGLEAVSDQKRWIECRELVRGLNPRKLIHDLRRLDTTVLGEYDGDVTVPTKPMVVNTSTAACRRNTNRSLGIPIGHATP